jgi:long-chain fatty acid transport protein
MSMKRGFQLGFFVILGLVADLNGGPPAFGGGYAVPPQTAKAASLANAVTAGVDDPSAVYANPAALSVIDGNQAMGGVTYINTLSSVGNGGRTSSNQHEHDLIPTLFANYHIPKTDLTLGLGAYAPFGLATTYDRDAFTRFAAIRSKLTTMFITPSIAWKPSPYFSIGGGVSFVRSYAYLSRAVFLGVGEGTLRITDKDDAYGYNFGILVRPHDAVKLGLTYRSRVDLKFDTADTKFQDAPIAGGAVSRVRATGIHIPLPPVVSAGVHWQINDAWGVELVYDFTRWSEFERLKANFETPLPALGGFVPISGFTIPENWKDTSTIRFGASFKATQNLSLRGGFALDQTPIPDSTSSPSIPGADFLTVTGGIGYNWGNLGVDVGYMAVFYKTRNVTNNVLETGGSPGALPAPGLSGRDKYETFQNLVSMHLRYRF